MRGDFNTRANCHHHLVFFFVVIKAKYSCLNHRLLPFSILHHFLSEQLLTAANDNSIRLWDCRQASQKSLGSFEAKTTVDVSWCNTMGQYMVVTERSGRVCVYDRRQLSPRGGNLASSSTTSVPRVTPVHAFHRPPLLADAAIFSPHGGEYLIASLTERGEGMSDLGVWKWKTDNNKMVDSSKDESIMRFPAHAGPIYTMALSQDGKRLVTGGADAMVGLWDTDSMICTHSFAAPTKLIRSVAISPKDWVAVSNEENDVFVVSASTAESLGQVVISTERGGAEEVVWHPRGFPLLACARVPLDLPHKPMPAPVVVAKLNINR